MSATIDLAALDGSGTLHGYLATPTDPASAGIVVVQEVFGINPGIRAMTDDWASHGYLALAPDLFWRLEPDVQLDPDVPEEMQRGIAMMGRLDIDAAVADIETAIKALRSQGCGKVGVVGFCMGGLLAYLSAARTDSDATVGYYGVSIDERLDEAKAIGKPLLLHIAARDAYVGPDKQAIIHAGLEQNRHVTLHDYDADHAFARHEGSARVPELAAQADARTLAFFAEHLS